MSDWPEAAWDDDDPRDDMVGDLLSDRAVADFDPAVGCDADMVEPTEPVEVER